MLVLYYQSNFPNGFNVIIYTVLLVKNTSGIINQKLIQAEARDKSSLESAIHGVDQIIRHVSMTQVLFLKFM